MSSHYLIRLEDNRGGVVETIQDSRGIVDDVLVPLSERRKGLLQFVDPYGTTCFNGLQASALLSELEEASSLVKTKEAEELLLALERLARQCDDGPHLFLKFYGD